MHSLTTHQQIFKQRRFRVLFVLCLVLSLLLGLIVVPIERSVGMITTPSDGLWWAIQTVTTVGYGDEVPVTDRGRIIGVVLQIVGAMMFSVLVAMISNYFSRIQDEFYWNRLFERMDRLENDIDDIRRQTAFIVRHDNHEEELAGAKSTLASSRTPVDLET